MIEVAFYKVHAGERTPNLHLARYTLALSLRLQLCGIEVRHNDPEVYTASYATLGNAVNEC